jgi:hypothetical protein
LPTTAGRLDADHGNGQEGGLVVSGAHLHLYLSGLFVCDGQRTTARGVSESNVTSSSVLCVVVPLVVVHGEGQPSSLYSQIYQAR